VIGVSKRVFFLLMRCLVRMRERSCLLLVQRNKELCEREQEGREGGSERDLRRDGRERSGIYRGKGEGRRSTGNLF